MHDAQEQVSELWVENASIVIMDTAAHVVALVSANIVMVQVNIKKRFNNHE